MDRDVIPLPTAMTPEWRNAERALREELISQGQDPRAAEFVIRRSKELDIRLPGVHVAGPTTCADAMVRIGNAYRAREDLLKAEILLLFAELWSLGAR